MLAMRIYHRQRQLGEGDGEAVLAQAGLSAAQVQEMHRYLAIANYPAQNPLDRTYAFSYSICYKLLEAK
jgi:nitrate reductase beta subunit